MTEKTAAADHFTALLIRWSMRCGEHWTGDRQGRTRVQFRREIVWFIAEAICVDNGTRTTQASKANWTNYVSLSLSLVEAKLTSGRHIRLLGEKDQRKKRTICAQTNNRIEEETKKTWSIIVVLANAKWYKRYSRFVNYNAKPREPREKCK